MGDRSGGHPSGGEPRFPVHPMGPAPGAQHAGPPIPFPLPGLAPPRSLVVTAEEIRDRAWRRFHHDPLFHARVVLAERVADRAPHLPRELAVVAMLLAEMPPEGKIMP